MHELDSSVPLFHTRIRGTRIVVTPELVFNVLHVPRVKHPDYLGCKRLRTMSKDEMIFSFCARPVDWGDRQFTPCSTFAKGPRFMNMVMTKATTPIHIHFNRESHRKQVFISPTRRSRYSRESCGIVSSMLTLMSHFFRREKCPCTNRSFVVQQCGSKATSNELPSCHAGDYIINKEWQRME